MVNLHNCRLLNTGSLWLDAQGTKLRIVAQAVSEEYKPLVLCQDVTRLREPPIAIERSRFLAVTGCQNGLVSYAYSKLAERGVFVLSKHLYIGDTELLGVAASLAGAELLREQDLELTKEPEKGYSIDYQPIIEDAFV